MPLTQEEAAAIVETMTIKQYKKGTILLREGEISTEAYFVLEGCVRQYYLVDGEEKTSNFLPKNNGCFLYKALGKARHRITF